MMNIHPLTGVRYGVIACASLDPDLVQDLCYGPEARDLSYEHESRLLQIEVEREADMIEEDCVNASVENLLHVGAEDTLIASAYERRGYPDRESFIDGEFEKRAQDIHIEEPVIGGVYEGVTYQIGWLGGAQLLWVLQGPVGWADRLCSPCVPNAADLDSGITWQPELPAGCQPDRDAFACYVVPKSWLSEAERQPSI